MDSELTVSISAADEDKQRPAGVTAIAVLFLFASSYLAVLAVIRLASTNAIPLALGAPLLHGLEIAGPYMFLLAAGVGAITGFGLLRLNNLARRVAIMIALAGIVLLVPKVSADAADLSPRLLTAALAVIVRVVIVWYLWQGWTAEKFQK